MAQQLADKRDLDFVLWEQFDNEALLQHEKYESYNRKTCDLMLSEARKIAIKELLPTMSDAEVRQCRFQGWRGQSARELPLNLQPAQGG